MNHHRPHQRCFTVLRGQVDSPAMTAGNLAGAVVAIGNFDGVHRGHRSVIDTALRRGRSHGRSVAALTFEPHPRRFLRPQDALFSLTPLPGKLRLLAATGLDGAIVLDFDAALAGLAAEVFIARILVECFAIAGAVIGFDFHFGKDRGGSPAFLREQGERHGFTVDIVPPLEDEGRPVSSGSIRAALAAGAVVEAAELIGHPWFVNGTVIHGDRRGRDLGFPTANLRLDPACGLKHGIYAVRVRHHGRWHDGVASFGRRPTFDNGAPLMEAFLFDFAGDLYGAEIDIALIGWIRPELRFDSIEALKQVMAQDCDKAREALSRHPGAVPPLDETTFT